MTFPSRLAFVESNSRSRRCLDRQKRSGHPRLCNGSSSGIPTATHLGASVEDIAAAATSTGISTAVPVDAVPGYDATYAVSSGALVDSGNVVFPNAASSPMLNVPEMVSYLLLTALFAALMMRTSQVEDAAKTRKRMQDEVRAMKLREMGEGPVSVEQNQRTLQRYEDAVRKEEALRTVLPGVRIRPPSARGQKEEEARALARRYLGREFDIGVPKPESETDPSMALGVVAAVALGQLFLMVAYMM